jgi:hypothetical protein
MIGQPTPAGQVLITNVCSPWRSRKLPAFVIGGNATRGFPPLTLAPQNQLPFTWLKDFDFRLNWVGNVRERFSSRA